MEPYVLEFREMDETSRMVVGGKGMKLGECSRIEGILVPEGFCVTTAAYKKAIGNDEKIPRLLDQLAGQSVEDREKISEISRKIRERIEGLAIEEAIVEAVGRCLSPFDGEEAWAVRSSATAEDLPSASFAGQQDTFLNIKGKDAVLHYMKKCWASLFTERAVIYRIQNGIDHREIYLSVLMQKMVFPQASGIIFTADPVTSNRKVLSIDAGFGLGEAFVSGTVSADNYRLQEGRIVEKRITDKKWAVYARKEGGTEKKEIEPAHQRQSALSEEQVLELERIGRKLEAHFGAPQDIEWCLADDVFYIVQSRPITTLYPIPEGNDQKNRVYLSTGHQQMMTDAMKPLGLSFFLLTTSAPMQKVGGRLFVDCTDQLNSPAAGKFLDNLEASVPLIKDALMTVIERKGFLPNYPEEKHKQHFENAGIDLPPEIENNPDIVLEWMNRSETSIEQVKQSIQSKSGSDLFDFILEDFQRLRKDLFDPQFMKVIQGVMDAYSWINENMYKWLGENNAAATLSQSVPNNITSKMGLDLLDVADVIRPYPEVMAYLQDAEDNKFLEGLSTVEGGTKARDALYAYLTKYGMRCTGEIDITKPRWWEKPTALVPLIMNNIKNFEPGEANRKFEQGRLEAWNKEQEILTLLTSLPDGNRKAEETKRRIRLLRNFSGFREYPKYTMIHRYFVYKQALLKEAEQLANAKVIHEKEDIYYLTFEELLETVENHALKDHLLRRRKEEHEFYKTLTPPRVITSEGEIITGEYNRENLPDGALAGLAVSAGIIEGRARVVINMEEADLEEGDILVTPFTDPSWTPLFVSIKGLITEVGGVMTHGAVIAREYGLPAVVGVENAVKQIKDGQNIRLNGTEGYIEIL